MFILYSADGVRDSNDVCTSAQGAAGVSNVSGSAVRS